MVDRVAGHLSLLDDWPAHTDLRLALNRMGTFDWDLPSGLLHMDEPGLALYDLRPDEYDDRPDKFADRFPPGELARLEGVVSRAVEDGRSSYGAYFRVRHRDESLHWIHTQGLIRRDSRGIAQRVIGVVRDAGQELADSTSRLEQDAQQWMLTSVMECTTVAVAHARTVRDVIDVLKESHGMKRLGASRLLVALVEAGRVHALAEDPEGSYLPEMATSRIEEGLPMSDVVRTQRPLFFESPEEFAISFPKVWPHISGLGITAAAYLPLIAQARPIGSLGLLYDDRSRFTPEDRDLLVTLSGNIAQSLQRAAVFEQEHDLAEGLQQAMLPRRIPAVPGAQISVRYRSARIGRDIGGDWYDVIPLPGGRVGAVIGDVQGHDTHAAAVMGQLRNVLRAYAAEGHPPATVMARTSVFLHELDTDRFATCLYVDADLTTGVVRLVRAGHVDPLIRDADGDSRKLPVPGGMPLGLSALFGRLDYPVRTIELYPGQTLVLFTDGLVEQPGTDLEDGMRQVMRLIRDGPQDLQLLADRLCATVDARGGEDDVAVLLLRRRGAFAPQTGGRLQQRVGPQDPDALAATRRMVAAAVGAWGARERTDEILLATNELITNALIHTDGGAVVTVRVLAGSERRLRVEVEDVSSALPRRLDIEADGSFGRGLMLVDRLVDAWGVDSRGSGKCVWCEFIIPDRPTR